MATDFDHIAPDLQYLAHPVDSLQLDPANANKHNARSLEVIRQSLQRFGQDVPLVVQKQGLIVRKGNGRLQAARLLGWKYIAAIVVDEDDTEAALRAITDNRSAQFSEWDTEALNKALQGFAGAGIDLEPLGWSPRQIPSPWSPPGASTGQSTEAPRSEPPAMAKPIKITEDQWLVVYGAVAKLRQEAGDETLSVGRCLELMAAEWLQDPHRNEAGH